MGRTAVVGVDPGLSGAVCLLAADGYGQQLLAVDDLPTVQTSTAGTVKRAIDPANFAQLLYDYILRSGVQAGELTVVLERMSSRPGGQGVASVFSLGDTFGALRAVAAALGMPVEYVTPAQWKREMKLGDDKEVARAMAIRYYPGWAKSLARKADHNRAEAILLARWWMRRVGGGKTV